MSEKVGRNDPCTCGSGKKYKNCCMPKHTASLRTSKHKITAKWLNAPAMPNLIERTFGQAIAETGKTFNSVKEPNVSSENKAKDEESPSS